MDVFVCAASEMEKKKAIVIVLLCTVILENICEGKIRGSQLLLPVSVNLKKKYFRESKADIVTVHVLIHCHGSVTLHLCAVMVRSFFFMVASFKQKQK